MTDFTWAARTKKALAIVACIDRELMAQGVDVYDQAAAILLAARDWTDAEWMRIADAAAVKTPSVHTREIVMQVYRSRAKAHVTPFPRLAS